jgi:hypothetical protein
MVALRQTALPSEYLGPPGATNVSKLLRPMPPVKNLYFSSLLNKFWNIFI